LDFYRIAPSRGAKSKYHQAYANADIKALPRSLTDQIARHRVDTFGESLAWALETQATS